MQPPVLPICWFYGTTDEKCYAMKDVGGRTKWWWVGVNAATIRARYY